MDRENLKRAIGQTALIALALLTLQGEARAVEGETRGAAARAPLEEPAADAAAQVRRGDALLEAGDLDGALGHYEEALRLAPSDPAARCGKGAALSRKGDLKGARAALEQALILNPNPLRAHYELGAVYQKLGRHDEAIAHFTRGIEKHRSGRR